MLAKIGFDTAENELLKSLEMISVIHSFAFLAITPGIAEGLPVPCGAPKLGHFSELIRPEPPACRTRSLRYGSYMVEGCPSKPFEGIQDLAQASRRAAGNPGNGGTERVLECEGLVFYAPAGFAKSVCFRCVLGMSNYRSRDLVPRFPELTKKICLPLIP